MSYAQRISALSRLFSLRMPRWWDLVIWVGIGVACFILSIGFNQYGFMHFEWKGYAPYHLGPDSIWVKIFNSRILDLDTYAGRELSYLIDHIDILFIAQSVKLGYPLFISITHIILGIFIGVWVAWFAAKDLRMGTTIGLLIALLFWSTTYVYINFLIRTAKILTATGVAILLVELFRAHASHRNGKGLSGRSFLTIFFSVNILAYADRQGLFFLLCIFGFEAVHWLIRRRRIFAEITLLLLLLIGIEQIYFYHLAPFLTQYFFDYSPNLKFTKLPYSDLWQAPGHYAKVAAGSLGNSIRFLLGNAPLWLLCGVLILWLGQSLRQIREQQWRRGLPLPIIIGGSLVLLWVMYVLMILRHPPILWPDIQRVYYWLPTGALVLVGLAHILANFIGYDSNRKQVTVTLILFVAVLANLYTLPQHQQIFATGCLQETINEGKEIRDALIYGDRPGYIIPSIVQNDPAYHALKRYALPPE